MPNHLPAKLSRTVNHPKVSQEPLQQTSSPSCHWTCGLSAKSRWAPMVPRWIVHPWRLTAGTYSHHPWKERKMIWTKPPGNYVPAVNLQGCIGMRQWWNETSQIKLRDSGGLVTFGATTTQHLSVINLSSFKQNLKLQRSNMVISSSSTHTSWDP